MSIYKRPKWFESHKRHLINRHNKQTTDEGRKEVLIEIKRMWAKCHEESRLVEVTT